MNPMQPVHVIDGVIRFNDNKIVRYLLDQGGIDLNMLAKISYVFSSDDWQQFYQLIGYSVSGYCDLARVSDQSKEEAMRLGESL